MPCKLCEGGIALAMLAFQVLILKFKANIYIFVYLIYLLVISCMT